MRKPAQQAYPDEFLFFWDQYPLKRDKGNAQGVEERDQTIRQRVHHQRCDPIPR